MESKHVIVGYIKVGVFLLLVSTLVGLIEHWSGAVGLSWWLLTLAWQRGFRPKWLLFSGMVMDFWLIRPLGVSGVVAGGMILLLLWVQEKRLPWWIWWGFSTLLTLFMSILLGVPVGTIAPFIVPIGAGIAVVWSKRSLT